MRMALVGRHERITAAAGPPARDRSARSSTRPSGCATRRRRWPRRSPRTRPRRCAPRSGRCGARSSSASPTPAAPAPQELVGDVGPPRPDRRARSRSPRSASRAGEPLDRRRSSRTMTLTRSYETLNRRAPRPGRLADQQPARAAQRDEQRTCATSSPTRGASSTPTPTVQVIVHTGEGRAFQTGVDVQPRSPPTASAWSATASRSRTGTCTSPRGTSRCGSR